jgi:hypothetical protein
MEGFVDIVLGVSMAPTAVRLVLNEGENADGVILEQDTVEVAAATGSTPFEAAADQVVAAIIGTREGAVEGGCQLTSTGVTWTDPGGVAALREAISVREVGRVMLVSPLLAAAALAQRVGLSVGYAHIAMLFVEPTSATLAIVDVADGSIVDLHRQTLGDVRVAGELAVMVADLGMRGRRADGVFLVGCGTDVVPIKPALEAATALDVSVHEEPDMALAHGAALASANAPLFNSTTAALAYALDPGTGEVGPRALAPSYLDISANADLGETVRAYSAMADDDGEAPRSRRRLMMAGGVVAAIVAGVLVVSLAFDRLTSERLSSVPAHPPAVPAQVPAQPPAAQMPASSSQLPTPPTVVAAPAAPPPVAAEPSSPVPEVPRAAPVYRAPVQRAPAPVPVQQAPAPAPAAPAPAPPPQAPPMPAQPPMTMYLHLPFVTVPIPLNPPPPPAPPPPAP